MTVRKVQQGNKRTRLYARTELSSLLPFIREILVAENCTFYCNFVIKIIETLLWIGLGLLFGFLNGAISGRVLVCLLQQSKQSQPEN